MGGTDDHHGRATVGLIIFGGYLCVYLVLLGLHLHELSMGNRNNFYLAVRGRLMLMLELVVNGFISSVIALRQIFKDEGLQWPCSISHLAVIMIFTTYVGTYLLRALILIVLFEPKWRSRYYRVLLNHSGLFGMWFVTLVVGLVVWAIVHNRKLCHELCVQANCYVGSNYYFTLLYNQIALSMMTQAALRIRKLQIDERLGLRREFMRSVISASLLTTPYYTILILQDWGLGRWWWLDWLCTGCGLAIFFNQFIFTQVQPSLRYGYSPFTRRAIRDSREAYRTMFKTAVTKGVATLSPRGEAPLSPRRHDDAYAELSIEAIVAHPELRGVLARFCRSCLCEELALFVIRMHTYKAVVREGGYTCERALRLRRDLVKRFVKEGSVFELHAAIPLDLREKVLSVRLRILRRQRSPFFTRLFFGRLMAADGSTIKEGTSHNQPSESAYASMDSQQGGAGVAAGIGVGAGGGGYQGSANSSSSAFRPLSSSLRHTGQFSSTMGDSGRLTLTDRVSDRLTLTDRNPGGGPDLEAAPGGGGELSEALEELNTIVLAVLTTHVLEALRSSRGYMRVLAGEADKARGEGPRKAGGPGERPPHASTGGGDDGAGSGGAGGGGGADGTAAPMTE